MRVGKSGVYMRLRTTIVVERWWSGSRIAAEWWRQGSARPYKARNKKTVHSRDHHSSCKHVCSRTRSVVSVQEQGRHHRCGLARGRRSPGCCRQSGVHRHRTRGHLQPLLVGKGMQRPVLEGSPSPGKRGRNRRPSRSKTRDFRAVRAGQRSHQRGSCVSCEPTCGMTAGGTVSGRAVRSHVTV